MAPEGERPAEYFFICYAITMTFRWRKFVKFLRRRLKIERKWSAHWEPNVARFKQRVWNKLSLVNIFPSWSVMEHSINGFFLWFQMISRPCRPAVKLCWWGSRKNKIRLMTKALSISILNASDILSAITDYLMWIYKYKNSPLVSGVAIDDLHAYRLLGSSWIPSGDGIPSTNLNLNSQSTHRVHRHTAI